MPEEDLLECLILILYGICPLYDHQVPLIESQVGISEIPDLLIYDQAGNKEDDGHGELQQYQEPAEPGTAHTFEIPSPENTDHFKG